MELKVASTSSKYPLAGGPFGVEVSIITTELMTLVLPVSASVAQLARQERRGDLPQEITHTKNKIRPTVEDTSTKMASFVG